MIKTYPPIWIIRCISSIRLFLLNIQSRLVPSYIYVFELNQQYWLSRAINVAAQLNIAELLKDGVKSIDSLAQETHSHKQSLYRLLRLLSSYGIFKEKPKGSFINTRFSKALIEGENSVRNMVMLHSYEFLWRFAGHMEKVVKTGKHESLSSLGANPFDYLKENKTKFNVFNKAMTESSLMSAHAILSYYPFEKNITIADIGGGQGLFLSGAMENASNAKGILFDLKEVVEQNDFSPLIDKYNERFSFVAGDFFKEIPVVADVYIMKSIIHDWSEEDSIQILKNLYKAMPINSKLLLVESLTDIGSNIRFSRVMDIMMLTIKSGGKERTMEEMLYLLRSAGFEFKRIIATATPFSIIESVKTN